MAREYPGGEPEHIPTEEQRKLVREFYAAGVPQSRLADYIGINENTLRKHYREEMDRTLDGMTNKLAKNLYQDALSGNEKAREFWLATRARWSKAKPPEDEKDKVATSLMEALFKQLKT